MTTLAEKVVGLHEALARARLPHAFGGALALAFHVAEPRATRDIDVNIFVDTAHVSDVIAALPSGVSTTADAVAELERDGQARILWDETPVDIFLSTHPFHDHASTRTVMVPFVGVDLPVLGALELCVFKAFFDRTKDWADIEAMLGVGSVDIPLALGWLVDLLGVDDHRVERLSRLTRLEPRSSGPRDPRFDPSPRTD